MRILHIRARAYVQQCGLETIYRRLSMSLERKWTAPDWRNPLAYGDVTSWGGRRWAWEFLRRNEDYQRISVLRGPANVQLDRGRKFGRAKLRPYWADYSKEEERNDVWLLDQVITAHGWEGFDSKPQTSLTSTEITVKFDLSVVMASGEAAVNYLIDRIKRIVDDEIKYRWGEEGFPAEPTRRPSTSDLFLYLRLIDAGRTSSLELAPFLYPEYCTPQGKADPILVRNGAPNISKHRSKAKKMVGGGYLSLVPTTKLAN